MIEYLNNFSESQIQDIKENSERIKKSLLYARSCLNNYFYGKGNPGEETLGVDNLPGHPMSYRAMLKMHDSIEAAYDLFCEMDSRVQRNVEELESSSTIVPRRNIK